MKDFEIDFEELIRALEHAPEAIGRGAKKSLGDVKDDWVREAVDIAPLDKRNLRDQIHGNVDNPGLDGVVEVSGNATSDTGGKRFNYGYYIHEGHMAADGKSLRTPGTEEKFLEKSAEKRLKEYEQWFIEDIEKELKREGW